MAEPDFYMVWRDGGSTPTCRHGDEQLARKEAIRLARANPGMRFYTLHAIESFVVPVPDVVCEKLDDEPPF